jgi:hypothetical protein
VLIRKQKVCLQRSDCQWYIFAKNKLDENLVEMQVDDAGIQHRFSYKLSNHSENMSPFPGKETVIMVK